MSAQALYQVHAKGDYGVASAIELSLEEALEEAKKWLDRHDTDEVKISPWSF